MAARSSSLPRLLTRARSEVLAPASDRELVERFTESGDEAAFAALLDRHGPMLLGVCRRQLRDADLADDVVQATFLVLARKAGSVRKRDSLASWLYGVAQRLARQARLAEAARSRREARVARAEAVSGDPAWDELLRVLDEELRRLPEKQRDPLLLCYLQGRTQDEAARQLGWSLSTLRRRLDAARDLLRRRMTRRGATLGAGLVAGLLAPTAARATLKPELRAAALASIRSGADAAVLRASVVALASGGLRLAAGARACLWSIGALTVAGVLVGAVCLTGAGRPTDAAPPDSSSTAPAASPVAGPTPGRDRFNDELPRGAVARVGTVAFRHGRISWHGALFFTPDGKDLVSTGGGWIRRWDVATGRAVVSVGDGWRAGVGGSDQATADGRTARICVDVPQPGGGVAWQCIEYDLRTGQERRVSRIEFPRDGGAHSVPSFLSPDGRTYAGLNDAGKLTLWNAADGSVTHSLAPAAGAFTALTFAPDGRTILAGDDHHGIHGIDRTTGKELRSFRTEGNVVARMAVSPDGKWLVTTGGERGRNPVIWPYDRCLRLWDLTRGSVVRTLEFPEDAGAQSLTFTPDSRLLLAGLRGALAGRRAAVRSWDVATGKPGRAWTDDPTIGLTLTVSPDGKTLATLNEDGVIRLWDLATGEERDPCSSSPCGLEAVGIRPRGRTLVTIGRDLVLRNWDATTGRPIGARRALGSGSRAALSADGRLALVLSVDKDRADVVRVYDAVSGRLLLERPGMAPVVSADGRRLALCDKGKRVLVLDIATGKELGTLTPAAAAPSYPFGFTPGGEAVILLGSAISVWDVRTGKQRSSWSLEKNHVLDKPADAGRSSFERVEAAQVSPDGRGVALSVIKDRPPQPGSQSWFCRLMVLETATGKLVQQIDVDGETVEALAFSPDGKRLAAGGAWTVRVWDIDSGRSAGPFEGHRGKVTSLAFSPEGKRLASASADSTVLVWDVSR